MKAVLLFVAILGLALLLLPMAAMQNGSTLPGSQATIHTPGVGGETASQSGSGQNTSVTQAPDPVRQLDIPAPSVPEQEQEASEEAAVGPASVTLETGYFIILDQTTGELHQVGIRDYVRGAVAAEMPVSFHEEALRAQAVAAHTYALRHHYNQLQNPDPALGGADFSADPSNRKGYMTEEAAKAFYGENSDLYWSKICQAADSVIDIVLEYDEEPIVAAYHAISAGNTEDASNVWIGSAPYLLSTQSQGDLLAPDFETTAQFTPEQVRQTLLAYQPGITLGEDPALWFAEPIRTTAGYVDEMEVGDVLFSGKELRTIFELRSHNFEVEYRGGGFVFTVQGYGHGVGLSQYGADYLARQGYAYDEILLHYYQGAELKKVALPQNP